MIDTVYDVLPQYALKKIQQSLLSSSFPWFFIPKTSSYKNADSDVINDCSRPMIGSWSHIVYQNEQIVGSHWHMLELALMIAAEKANINVNKIIRIRLGLILSNETSQHTHGAHADLVYPHTTALFYLNDSDGDTILYNEMYDVNYQTNNNFIEDKSKKYYDTVLNGEVTVDTTITPEENKFVFFNGLKYHSSSTPLKNNYRIVVNYNFI